MERSKIHKSNDLMEMKSRPASAFRLIIPAAIVCIIAAVCCLIYPFSKDTSVMGANYSIEKILYAADAGDEASAEPPLQYCVSANYHLYHQQKRGGDWIHLGSLTPYALTNKELYRYMSADEPGKTVRLRPITDAYILRVENDHFYLVFQTKDEKTYLAYGREAEERQEQTGANHAGLQYLYLLDSSFHSGYMDGSFFQRSLTHTAGKYVSCFHHYESDQIPGYHIVGFKAGSSSNPAKMTDLGFAVFQTSGESCRFIDLKVYANAALAENGIFFCQDPAVANVNGKMRNDNTFDVVLILNEEVDKIARVYRTEGKEDRVQYEMNISAPHMSLWSWKYAEASTAVSQYVYDKNGKPLPYDSTIPLNSASWRDWPID